MSDTIVRRLSMRVYQEGFELDAAFVNPNSGIDFLPVARWVSQGTGQAASVVTVSGNPLDIHKNPNGDGGIRALSTGNFTAAIRFLRSPELPFKFRYGWVGAAIKHPLTSDYEFRLGFSYLSGGYQSQAKQMDITVDFTGLVSIRVDEITVATAASTLTPDFHWYAIEYFCDDTNGFINVWVDDILWVSFSGDTQGDTFNYWDNLQVNWGFDCALDDIVINAATITYTGGSSTPTLGATVSGGTSLANAVITDFVETSPGEGFLVLEPSGASAPSGFVSGEALSDGFGWTATSAQVAIDANGLDKNSGRPPENFLLLLRPTDDVAVDFVGQDGNSVDNFLNVDDDPFGDILDYNEGDTNGQRDIYELENLPFSPETIEAVEVVSGENGRFSNS
jgi:hypothetical protein